MKKTVYLLLPIFIIALFSSCNREIPQTPESPSNGMVKRTIHLSADEMIVGKAAFGDKTDGAYPMLWQEGDKVIVNVNGEAALTQELTVTPTNGGRTADFGECTLEMPAVGEVTLYVTTNTTKESGGKTANIKYSTTKSKAQKPTASSCDPECVVLFTKQTYASAAEVPADDIKLSFSHSTAYGLMSFSGLDFGGESVKLIELQTSPEQKIGGEVTVGADGSLSAGDKEIITLHNDEVDLTGQVWFAICPTTLNTAGALTVHVVTSGDRHFEKSLNCSAKSLVFAPGQVSKFTVNFSGISAAARQVKTMRDMVILKAAFNNDDYGYWLNGDDEILLANDIDYDGAAFDGTAALPAGVTFNGQNHSIQNAIISKTLFSTVNGTVKNLTIQDATINTSLISTVEGTVKDLNITGGQNTNYLFETVSGQLQTIFITGLDSDYPLINSVSGTVDGLTVDNTTTYDCPWTGNNMGFVAQTNTGIIENSTVSATINAGDPARTAFFFGVFCPKCTSGQFINCVNNGNVSLTTSTAVSGCGLGGIVGMISSNQDNRVNILEECKNNGSVVFTLNTPASGSHRLCCVGGVVGGNYKGATDNSGAWKNANYPSTGKIYNCSNGGEVVLNYHSVWENPSSNATGSQGAAIGGIAGATVNDIDNCTNSGSVTANFNVGHTSDKAGAPKIGGVVGAAHRRVTKCINDTDAKIKVNGAVRNVSSNLYAGTGPVCYPCIGGVAGCVGCDTAEHSTTEGSEISNCQNKSASITNNTSYGTTYLGSICGWTVATNSNNTDSGSTGLPILNPE